jgi:predicted nicotinamide N-methyase
MLMSSDPVHATAIAASLARLRQQIAHTGPLMTELVAIPRSCLVIEVTRPTDTNRLLDQVADDPEQNLPYWSEIWPSGIALAGDIVRHPERVRGRRVLELGSGVGITAAVALSRSAMLTVSDYAEESLCLTRMTCLQNAGSEPAAAHQVNWRTPAVSTLAGKGRFDVVLAADCLYETRDIEPLKAAIDVLVAPGGALWLAEPGRKPAKAFLQGVKASGWQGWETRWDGPWPDPTDAGIEVCTHWLRRRP